jgi:hypothetical protein
MGRTPSESQHDQSSDKQEQHRSDSESHSDLDEQEFIVEKILKMRTTKKGKVQCKFSHQVSRTDVHLPLSCVYLRSIEMERLSRQ